VWLARTHALASVLAPLLLTSLALWAAVLLAWTWALFTVLARLFRSTTWLRSLALFPTRAPMVARSAVAPRSPSMTIITFTILVLALLARWRRVDLRRPFGGAWWPAFRSCLSLRCLPVQVSIGNCGHDGIVRELGPLSRQYIGEIFLGGAVLAFLIWESGRECGSAVVDAALYPSTKDLFISGSLSTSVDLHCIENKISQWRGNGC
jgi:hypothetical protein